MKKSRTHLRFILAIIAVLIVFLGGIFPEVNVYANYYNPKFYELVLTNNSPTGYFSLGLNEHDIITIFIDSTPTPQGLQRKKININSVRTKISFVSLDPFQINGRDSVYDKNNRIYIFTEERSIGISTGTTIKGASYTIDKVGNYAIAHNITLVSKNVAQVIYKAKVEGQTRTNVSASSKKISASSKKRADISSNNRVKNSIY